MGGAADGGHPPVQPELPPASSCMGAIDGGDGGKGRSEGGDGGGDDGGGDAAAAPAASAAAVASMAIAGGTRVAGI